MRDEQKVELRQELAAAVGPVSEAVQGNAAEPTPTAEQATEPTKQADTAPTTATSLAKQAGEAERVAETLEVLCFFFPPGERHELLAITKARKTFGGVFDDLGEDGRVRPYARQRRAGHLRGLEPACQGGDEHGSPWAARPQR